jgi:hypothetical protein
MQQDIKHPSPSPLVKNTTPIQLILSAWMLAVLVLYLLLFPPAFLTELANRTGRGDMLLTLQNKIRPFFQTKDLSDYLEIR